MSKWKQRQKVYISDIALCRVRRGRVIISRSLNSRCFMFNIELNYRLRKLSENGSKKRKAPAFVHGYGSHHGRLCLIKNTLYWVILSFPDTMIKHKLIDKTLKKRIMNAFAKELAREAGE